MIVTWVRRVACEARSWYDRNAPLIVGVMFFLTLVSVMIGVAGVFENNRQNVDAAASNRTRDEQNAAVLKAQQHLLHCFNTYANAQASGNTKVRAATVAVDAATSIRDDALNTEALAFKKVTHGIRVRTVTAEDFNALDAALAVLTRTGRALDKAQAELDQARTDNPIPPPPSKFCAD